MAKQKLVDLDTIKDPELMTDEQVIAKFREFESYEKDCKSIKDFYKKEIEKRIAEKVILDTPMYTASLTEFKSKRLDTDEVKRILQEQNLEVPYKESDSKRLKIEVNI